MATVLAAMPGMSIVHAQTSRYGVRTRNSAERHPILTVIGPAKP